MAQQKKYYQRGKLRRLKNATIAKIIELQKIMKINLWHDRQQ